MWRPPLKQHLLTHMSSSLSFVDRLVYMEEEDGLLHFFWKNRTTNLVEDVCSTYLSYSHFKKRTHMTESTLSKTLADSDTFFQLHHLLTQNRIWSCSQETQNCWRSTSAQQDELSSSSSNHPHKSSSSGFRSPTPIGIRSSCNRQTPSSTRVATAVSEMTMSTWSKNGILPCYIQHTTTCTEPTTKPLKDDKNNRLSDWCMSNFGACALCADFCYWPGCIKYIFSTAIGKFLKYRNKDVVNHWTRRTK